MSQIEHSIKSILNNSFLYHLFQWSVGATRARKRLIHNFAQPKPEMNILDIGCGPGTIIKYLPFSVHYFGLDSNEKYIASASKKFGNTHKFFHEDANNITWKVLGMRFCF